MRITYEVAPHHNPLLRSVGDTILTLSLRDGEFAVKHVNCALDCHAGNLSPEMFRKYIYEPLKMALTHGVTWQ